MSKVHNEAVEIVTGKVLMLRKCLRGRKMVVGKELDRADSHA